MAVPLTATHHYQLRRFVALVDEMSRSRLIERYRTQDHTISRGTNANGEPQEQNPEYDWENFRSFLLSFRQIAYAQKDRPSVNLKTILDITEQYASSALKEGIGKMREVVLPILEGRYIGIKVTKFKQGSDFEPERSFTSHEVMNILINGRLFHPDKRFEEDFKILEEAEPWFYLWPVLHEIVEPTLRNCVWFFKALRAEGILRDEDFPSHCFAKPCTSDPLEEV